MLSIPQNIESEQQLDREINVKILMQALLDTITEFFHITEEQLADFTTSFINRLPKYMQDALSCLKIA